MVLNQTGRSRICKITAVTAFAIILIWWPAGAQTPAPSAPQQWQSLNGQAIEAENAFEGKHRAFLVVEIIDDFYTAH
jgi:predicted secreted Zn-dependent protease